MLFSQFGGTIGRGARDRLETLDEKKVANAERLSQYVQANPYATEEQIQAFAQTLGGSSRYQQAPTIGEGSVSAFSQETAGNRNERDTSRRLKNAQTWQQFLDLNPNATEDELRQMSQDLFNGEDLGFNSDNAIEQRVVQQQRDAERERLKNTVQQSQMVQQLGEQAKDRLYEAWKGGTDLTTAMGQIQQQAEQLSEAEGSPQLADITRNFLSNQNPRNLDAEFASRVMEDEGFSRSLSLALADDANVTLEQLVSYGGLPPAMANSPFLRQLLEQRRAEFLKKQKREALVMQREEENQQGLVYERIIGLGQMGQFLSSDEINKHPYVQQFLARGGTIEQINDGFRIGQLGAMRQGRLQAAQSAQQLAIDSIEDRQEHFLNTFQAAGEDAYTPKQRQAITQLGGYVISPSQFGKIEEVLDQTRGKNVSAQDIFRKLQETLGENMMTPDDYVRTKASSTAATPAGFNRDAVYVEDYTNTYLGSNGQPGELEEKMQEIRSKLSDLTNQTISTSSGVASSTQKKQFSGTLIELNEEIAGLKAEIRNVGLAAQNPGAFLLRYGDGAELEGERVNNVLLPALSSALAELEKYQQEATEKAASLNMEAEAENLATAQSVREEREARRAAEEKRRREFRMTNPRTNQP